MARAPKAVEVRAFARAEQQQADGDSDDGDDDGGGDGDYSGVPAAGAHEEEPPDPTRIKAAHDTFIPYIARVTSAEQTEEQLTTQLPAEGASMINEQAAAYGTRRVRKSLWHKLWKHPAELWLATGSPKSHDESHGERLHRLLHDLAWCLPMREM